MIAYSSFVEKDLESLREQLQEASNAESFIKDLFNEIDQDRDSLLSEEEVKKTNG